MLARRGREDVRERRVARGKARAVGAAVLTFPNASAAKTRINEPRGSRTCTATVWGLDSHVTASPATTRN